MTDLLVSLMFSHMAVATHYWEANKQFYFASAKIICKPSHIGELNFIEIFFSQNFNSDVNIMVSRPPSFFRLLEIFEAKRHSIKIYPY